MKKIIAIFLILNLLSLPVMAEVFDYSKYDFSDEAQTRFDNMQNYNPLPNNEDDFSVTKHKGKNKNTSVNDAYQPLPPVNPIQEPVIQNNAFYPDNSDYYPEYRRTQDNNYSNQNKVQEQFDNPYVQNVDNQSVQNSSKPLSGHVVYVPEGTILEIMFESGISSGSLDKNDRITAVLPRDFIYNGYVIAPAGSLVYGTVTDAQAAGYAYGAGSMALKFDEIQPLEGNPFKISTVTAIVKGQSTRAKSMTRDVLVGTGMGLIGGMLGFLLTGGAGSEQFVRALAIGSGIGAAAGGIRGGMTRGEDVRIPDGAKIKVRLAEPINISPYN